MREGWKIAGCVALIGLLGADIGLQITSRFALPPAGVVEARQGARPEGSQKAGYNPKTNDTYSITLIVTVLGAGTSILTLFVISYQTLIFRGQHKIMERQTEIADQMRTGAFWPHLVVEEPRFDTLVSTNDAGARRPTATYTLRSVGGKTVILKSLRQQIIFDTSMPRKIDPQAPWPVTYQPMHEGDFSIQTADYLEEVTVEVDREMRGLGRITRKRFFLVIEIVCEDVFGQQHEFGWCFHGSRRGGPGLPYGGTIYNYRRIRKPAERI